jgi:hypothetical protein
MATRRDRMDGRREERGWGEAGHSGDEETKEI